jgi:aspartyl-tRNA(Asn)/glutamyl-tRNA(Gln) amidotransferase subunit B
MKYQPVIGMEIHTELLTASKVFNESVNAFGGAPNTHINPVDLGLPGTLPVLNRRAFELSIRTALALNCDVPKVTKFDRKNYYYPDLPKNYQISQQYEPLGRDGWLVIEPAGGAEKKIGIDNIHLEEDAGKNVHPEGGRDLGKTYVDLNRAGVPLLEIVSKPDMRSPEEMEAFMNTMRSLLRYIEVSDCKIQEGSIRFEVNCSLLNDDGSLGTKVEVKNVGSMKAAMRALRFELNRQAECRDRGERVIQETRLWDDERGETRSMRSKEGAKDYRYFPEPDLVPMVISSEWLEMIRSEIPELREAKRKRLVEQYGIPEYDAAVLAEDKAVANFFEKACQLGATPKTASNWIMTDILRDLKEAGDMVIDEMQITAGHLAQLLKMIDEGTISGKIAKQVYNDMKDSGKMPKAIVEEKGLVQVSDDSAICGFIDKVIQDNPGPVEDFRGGKDKALGFLMGQVMRMSQGKANPQRTRELLIEKIRG